MNKHIIACDGTNPDFPFGFACLNCGAKKQITSSLPVVVWIELAKGFREKHTQCKAVKSVQEVTQA